MDEANVRTKKTKSADVKLGKWKRKDGDVDDVAGSFKNETIEEVPADDPVTLQGGY